METLIKKLRVENIYLSINGDDLEVRFNGDTIPSELIQDLRDNKQALIQYIKSNQRKKEEEVAIKPLPVQDAYILSSSQKRSWILSQLGGNAAYNMTVAMVFDGQLNREILEKAFFALVERHEILRTVFKEDDKGEVWQYILSMEEQRFRVSYLDLQTDPFKEEKSYAAVQKETLTSFDLSRGPLFGVKLIQTEPEQHIVTLVMHHIIGDDWSTGIFVQELMTFYNAFIKGETVPLAPLKFHYKDYAAWQRNALEQKHRKNHQAYWMNKFAGTIPVLEMPTDKARPSVRSYEGGELEKWISKELTQKFKRLVESSGVTFFMGLLSLVKALLYIYTRQKDIVVGSVIAGRVHADLENQIGFYVNTLAFRTQFSEKDSYKELLARVKKVTLETYEHQVYPFDELVNDLKLERNLGRNPLFDAFVIMHNNKALQATGDNKGLEGIKVSSYNEKTTIVSWFDVLFDFLEVDDGIRINLGYNTDIFTEATAIQLGEHFEQLMLAVTDAPDQSIHHLAYLTDTEKQKLLFEFNDTAFPFPKDQFLFELFEEQVKLNPDKVAISFDAQNLTYRELDEKSNQLAHYILERKQQNGLVAICMHRSIDLLIGLWAILKSAHTYVPIDPNYPEERIQYILEDAKVDLVLCQESTASLVQRKETLDTIVVETSWSAISKQPKGKPAWEITADHAAYIIYTSGSSGKPKGVIISHGNLQAFLHWAKREYAESNFEVVFAGTSVCFDLSIFEIFLPLTMGKRIRLVENGLRIADYINHEEAILLNTVPSVMKALIEQQVNFSKVTVINMAGEVIPLFVQENLDVERMEVRNLYGPSEDTTYSTMYRLQKKAPILIGQPIANTQVYIVDEYLNLLPRGAKGELCLSGAGVAQGYLHRPELSAEKFIDHPFDPESTSKLYRTGDLARWLPDGTLDLLGRMDTQVKVRGYRIELGEIETVLEQSSMIDEVVVLAKEDRLANKRLVAYAVTNARYDKEEVQAYLKSKLPNYMIPALIIELEKLPLTPNGKVNKAALPDPNLADLLQRNYVAPRNELEFDLVEIWEQLLRLEKVGIHDNFFELGGDSIVSIQVVSRINRKGFQLVPIDLFENQTIAELVAFIHKNQSNKIIAEQELLSGELDLLGIQQWFFEQETASVDHFNQSVLLNIEKQISSFQLEETMKAILLHHDALRLSYELEDGTWSQTYGHYMPKLQLEDLSNETDLSTEKLNDRLNEICQTYQESLSLQEGKLIQFVLVKTPEEISHNRLFIVIHHLAVDGVSWRILLDDMTRCLKAILSGATIDLGKKTSSYRQWINVLKEYSYHPKVEAQLPFWEKTINAYQALPHDYQSESKSTREDIAHCSIQLAEAATTSLLLETNQKYQTEINDLLLAALLKTIADWSRQENLVVALEGHGREDLFAGINTSNTIGWFTNMYPVLLSSPQKATITDLIKTVKEQLRSIPEKGLGYSLLRYLHPDEQWRSRLAGRNWDIVFNYLGQLDNVLEDGEYFGIAAEPSGENVAKDFPLTSAFEINGLITNGKLRLDWFYSKKEFDEQTITKLTDNYIQNLQLIIEHCQKKKYSEKTPSDFGLAPEVNYQELDAFLEDRNSQPKDFADDGKHKIIDLYRLSPLQEGMLFHHLYDKKDSAYTEQMVLDIASGLDLEAFATAWRYVIGNHSILRTAFFNEALDIPVQAVYDKVDLAIETLDYSHLEKKAFEEEWNRLVEKELAKGFDFSQAPLMRMHLVKVGAASYKMLWLFHHILIDGWSLPILMEELLSAYEALVKGATVEELFKRFPKKEDKFGDYIKYLSAKDKYKEKQFWKTYLNGFEEASLLAIVNQSVDRNKGGIVEDTVLEFPEKITEKIRNYAQANRITVNTLIQGAWSFLLSKYTGQTDVLYGVTVSGRPSDLANVENRIGLYINAIPLRVKISSEQSIAECLSTIQQEHAAAREFQYTALTDIQRWNTISGDLFDTLLAFENYPIGEVVGKQWSLAVDSFEIKEETNYLLSLTVALSKVLQIKFSYKMDLLPPTFVEMVKNHFELLLDQIVTEGKTKFSEIELLREAEKNLLLKNFNNTKLDYPKDQDIVAVFEKQCQLHPNKTALIFGQEKMTYQELAQRSNQLAAYLKEQGVQSQDKVGLLSYRGFDMIIGLFGILKCGAIYVPLNVDYPSTRINYILEDAKAKHVLYNDEVLLEKITLARDNYHFISIAESTTTSKERLQIDNSEGIDAAAYVMYTSGTTGEPKGIVVSHRNILKLSFEKGAIAIYPEDRVLQWSNVSFDGSTYEIFGALLNGASLCLISEQAAQDPSSLAKVIDREKLTVSFITTALFNAFVDTELETLKQLRILLFGGELVAVPQVKKAVKALGTDKIIHVYGPTETTTYASYYPVKSYEDNRVPIGRPLSNTRIHILDETQQLVGIGLIGEIYIAGDGVSKGYLDRSDLTNEKFLDDPFSQEAGAKMYRTGDLGFWLPDGNIEFVGRKDLQVKIRGYRIELGEIESKLQASALVKKALVIAKKDSLGNKKLIAYIVPDGVFDKASILHEFKLELPEYMIPSMLIELEAFPLNENGKIDRKALPTPDIASLRNNDFVAPRNQIEKDLAEVWQSLLDVQQVSIHDNFFELGGDSIITIQVISRIKRLNYQAQTRDLFLYPTVASLADFIASNANVISTLTEEGMLTGTAKLLPIQHWFLEKPYNNQSHFNQENLFEIAKDIDAQHLDLVFKALVQQHDALRFRYIQKGTTWTQEYGDHEASLIERSIEALEGEELNKAITAICQEAQESLSLEMGILVRMVLIKTPSSEKQNRLFIVAHHLVIDGVSWRIFLDHFELGMNALKAGQTIDFGKKTSSYRQWGNALEEYVSKDKVLAHLTYWESVADAYQELAVDKIEQNSSTNEMRFHSVQLSESLTQSLLQEVNQAYRTEINDILICALALTMRSFSGEEEMLIGLEGHGREFITPEIDSSNTIGWFTNLYPVALKLETDLSNANCIKAIKEQLRLVPDKGMSFGLLRYMHPSAEIRERLAKIKWDIVFNYLGQLDNIIEEDAWLTSAEEHRGHNISDGFVFDKLGIDAVVSNGQLSILWKYSNQDFENASIEKLAESYLKHLSELIHHCQTQSPELTASDYGLSPEIGYKEFDDFLNTTERGVARRDHIETLYRLSPLQEGMFFLNLYNEDVSIYTDQLKADILNLDLDLFRASWENLVAKHSILRTAFFNEGLSIPVQCVYKEIDLPIEVLDYSALNDEEQEKQWNALLEADIERRFDFAKAPLMRFCLVKIKDQKYRMIWTFHHILLDGWSLPILVKEFLQEYENLISETNKRTDDKPSVIVEDRYEDYIQYIASKDRFDGMEYWTSYLKGFDSPSLLPFVNRNLGRNRGGQVKEDFLIYGEEFTRKVKNYAKANQITINTLIQGVWGFLLYKYTNNEDVIFGVTVSGRPSDLVNIEQRVGMYINAIPLRVQLQAEQSVAEVLSTLQEEHTASREYQYTALSEIQKWIGIPGDLFDSIIIFENYPMGDIMREEWSLEMDNFDMRDQNNYLFSLEVTVLEKEFAVKFAYIENLLGKEYAEMIQKHFDQVLQQIVEKEVKHFSDIQLLTSQEQDILLDQSIGERIELPEDKMMIDLFEERANKTPNRLAIVYDDETLSYQDLDEKSNQLAHYLRRFELPEEALVGVCLHHSVEMLVCLLAIQKIGAAHVPIDPMYPQDRIDYVLNDTQAALILCSKAQNHLLGKCDATQKIFLEDIWSSLEQEARTKVERKISPTSLSYVIYTSGSTGQPKGVMIHQRGLIDFLWSMQQELKMTAEESFLAISTFSFDIAYLEMYLPLMLGAKVILGPPGVRLDGHLLKELLAKTKPNYLQATPANWQLLLNAGWTNEENVEILCGGEAMSHELKNALLSISGKRVFNLYGPTETTVWTSAKALTAEGEITIGKPIANTEIYILNPANASGKVSSKDLVPTGLIGEICIGGISLARAYLNSPELTDEKFVPNPFSTEAGARLYRTGDLGRWLANGEIECLGRVDDQVKIRGHRIELGEIETIFRQSPLVKECVVLAQEDATKTKSLVAYITSTEAYSASMQEAIREHLKLKLPAYMIPALIKHLDHFPLSPNGKIDKKVLPTVEAATMLSANYEAPRNEVESSIAKIWTNLLAIEKVGIHDNFFELGGHSILAVRLIAELYKELSIKVPIKTIFEYNSIAKFYDYLRITKLISTDDDEQDFETLEL